MRNIIAFTLLLASAPALAAPPPPPAPAVAAFYDDFFRALPNIFPGDLVAVTPMVHENVEVYRDGELQSSTRDEWFSWLQGLAGSMDSASTSREEFFYADEDSILVREFWWPYKKDVMVHPEFPVRFVRYHFHQQKLVRVDYLMSARPTNVKFGAENDG
ncbi:hypothetical protein K3148_12735 [Qipengyuania aurantiaca]|uniref:Nuclear transport factor 2 family protein n=1 Tax=Qipengyuania aurantiaca TaxID=2867233 RepID=A0ABX8ZKX2_9SPHN|nr:hypothetical protein [Qipengyuania aurantiaca]QZD89652.1 hypothetical protein K3148_12735 [Qipengyuania aurantiaca]